jgi:hypothetical protein
MIERLHAGSSARTRALVVQPDRQAREAWGAALRLQYQVEEVEVLAEGLTEPGPELVVAEAVDARRLLRTLDRVAPSAVRILVADTADAGLEEELVDLASEGHVFHVVPRQSAAGLLAPIQAVMSRRRGFRCGPRDDIRAELGLGGELLSCRCANISNEGLLLVADGIAPLERLVPGTRLDSVCLWRGGTRVLQSAEAVIRHLRTVNGELQIGVELTSRAPRDAGQEASGSFVADRAAVLALVRRALRRNGTLLAAPHGARQPLGTFAATLVDGGGDRARARQLRCSSDERWLLAEGDVMEVRFEVSGKSYRGASAVVATFPGAFHLSVPRVLEVHHRRLHQRFRPDAGAPFRFRYTSPLTYQVHEQPVADLDVRGLAFVFDGERDVLPAGLALEQCELILPDGSREPCTATVRTPAQQMPGSAPGALRCGVLFGSLSAGGRHGIFNGFVRSRCPEVRGAHGVSFRQIWELLNAARLFHPDYPFQPGPHLDQLETVHRVAAAAEDGLCRTFAYLDEGALAGHASGLRVSSRTWMLQHLAVQPGFHRSEQVSRELSMLAVDLAEALHDVDWVRILWRVENRWPDRIFGWIARAMAVPGLTQLRRMHYLRHPSTGWPTGEADLPVRDATATDLATLERLLRARGELVRVLSDDLGAVRSGALSLAARYRNAGLRRDRRILVAGPGDAPVGFALCDLATPGLCWSELTNTFQLVPSEVPLTGGTVAALAAACARAQGGAGVPSSLALARPEDVPALQALGYTDHGEVAEWTFHRRLARSWHTLMGTFFERLERRAQRPRRDNGDRAA